MQTLHNEYASNVILTQHYFYFYIKETHITSFRNLSNLSEHITAVTHISKHHRFKLSSHILYRLRNKTFKLSSDILFNL